MTDAPDFIKKAVKASPVPPPPEDKLKALRAKAAEVRDDLLVVSDLEAKLAEVQARIVKAKTQELPDMMEELRINNIGLAAEGNLPAYSVTSKPFYRASISASWPIEQKAKAYKLLDDWNAGDLLKTEVTITFGRGDRDAAKRLLVLLRENAYEPEVAQGVPHTTLTAWLKEQVEVQGKMPPLDVIGGMVGRVVDLKPMKEK